MIYGKEVNCSKTIMSIIKSKINFKNCKINIWNNGPDRITLKSYIKENLCQLGFDFELLQTINNKSLAYIYNYHIKLDESEKYIFLDDDSLLNDIYLNEIININSFSIALPLIKVNNSIIEPRVDDKIVEFIRPIKTDQKIMSIGSGLVINRKLVNVFERKFEKVFDERFYLYGVDSCFFMRFNNLHFDDPVVVISFIEHSLSRVNNETYELKKFRAKERAYSMALYLRFYIKSPFNLFLFIKIFSKNIILLLLNRGVELDPFQFVLAFINAKHYRDRNS